MFILGKLVFKSYIPREFEIGMLFLRKVRMIKLRTLIEYDEVFELKEIPGNREAFLLINGAAKSPTKEYSNDSGIVNKQDGLKACKPQEAEISNEG